jgi:hypothetical protein
MDAEGRLACLIADVLATAERSSRDVLKNNNSSTLSFASSSRIAFATSQSGGPAAVLQQRHCAADFIGSTVGSMSRLLPPFPRLHTDAAATRPPAARLQLLKLTAKRIETLTKVHHGWLLQMAVLTLPMPAAISSTEGSSGGTRPPEEGACPHTILSSTLRQQQQQLHQSSAAGDGGLSMSMMVSDAVDRLADAAGMALLRLYSSTEALCESLASLGLLPISFNNNNNNSSPSAPAGSPHHSSLQGPSSPAPAAGGPVTVHAVDEAVTCGAAIAAAAKLCQQLMMGGMLVEPQQPSAAGQAYRSAVALAGRLLGSSSPHASAMSSLLSRTSCSGSTQGRLLRVLMPHVDCFPALYLCGRAEVALYSI